MVLKVEFSVGNSLHQSINQWSRVKIYKEQINYLNKNALANITVH